MVAHSTEPAPAASNAPQEQTLSATQSGQTFSLVATEHFKLVYAADEQWAHSIARMLETGYGRFCQSMRRSGISVKPLNGPLVWVCFDRHDDFEAYAVQADHLGVSWTDGYYSMRTNVVAVARPALAGEGDKGTIDGKALAAARPAALTASTQPSVPEGHSAFLGDEAIAQESAETVRATHEAAHQFAFNTGLQKRGVVYPLWVSEGLATNFECDDPNLQGFEHDNPIRRIGLIRARAGQRVLSLADLIVQTQTPAGGAQGRDLYAQCWGLFRFCLKTRPEALAKYLKALAALPPGNRVTAVLRGEFIAAFGPIEQLEGPWASFLDSLDEPAR